MGAGQGTQLLRRQCQGKQGLASGQGSTGGQVSTAGNVGEWAWSGGVEAYRREGLSDLHNGSHGPGVEACRCEPSDSEQAEHEKVVGHEAGHIMLLSAFRGLNSTLSSPKDSCIIPRGSNMPQTGSRQTSNKRPQTTVAGRLMTIDATFHHVVKSPVQSLSRHIYRGMNGNLVKVKVLLLMAIISW